MSNIWGQFAKLTNQKIRKIGTVTAHTGNVSIVEDRSGNTFRVDGTEYAVNDLVYIENNIIISKAPALTNVGVQYV